MQSHVLKVTCIPKRRRMSQGYYDDDDDDDGPFRFDADLRESFS